MKATMRQAAQRRIERYKKEPKRGSKIPDIEGQVGTGKQHGKRKKEVPDRA